MRAYHCLIAGDSGGGKTTLLREVHSEVRAPSIWVNTTKERGVSGVLRSSGAGIISAVGEFERWEDVRVNMQSDRPPLEAFGEARRVAREIFESAGRPVQLIVDEAHTVLPDSKSESGAGSGNPVRDSLHEDRDHGVKVVLATQDPQDLYYPPIKQCRHFAWCGPPNSFHKGFLDYYNLAGVGLPTREFEIAVIRPTLPPTVVWRGETDPAYS